MKMKRAVFGLLLLVPLAMHAQTPSPIEPTPLQQPESVQEQKQSVAEPAQQRPVVESTSTNAAYRWYAGIELGVPVAVSTFSSFASHGGAGFEGGVLAGYRFSPLLSAEVGISLGTMRLGSNKCCGEYFLGADGGRYLEHVAGMKSYSYNDIYSSVSVQQYALRLNVDMLQIVNPDWNKRWSLILSPAIYGIGTKATLRQSGSEDKIIRRDGQFQFAAGATIGGGYQITRNLGVGLRTGMVWVMGDHFDGIAPSDHSENMIWNNTVTFTWRFGRNK